MPPKKNKGQGEQLFINFGEQKSTKTNAEETK